MLNLITGVCGSGKTSECMRRIAEAEQVGEKAVYIVPQQFTLEAERMFLEKNTGHVMMNTRVLSFRRLAYVLMNSSDQHRPTLSALGRAFLVRKTVYDERERLEYFSKVIDKQGFLDSLVNLLTEFYQYDISPEMLLDASQKVDHTDSLHLKLKDLYIIFSSYKDALKDKYIAAEETLDILADCIKNSEYIKSTHIFIDMMDYFIPQEYKVIAGLLKCAKSVTIALNCDRGGMSFGNLSVYDPYFESKRTIMRLKRLAEECGSNIEAVFLPESKRHAEAPEFLHLQQNYFAAVPKAYKGTPRNIHLISAANMQAETEELCRNIIKTVKTENIRYDNIAVVIDKSYETEVKEKLEEYNIPVFIDSSRPITQHPLTALILCVVDILCRGYENRSLFPYAKNIFSPVSEEDVFYLENYVLKNDIKRSAWHKKEWTYGFPSNEEADCVRINNAKNALIGSLSKIVKDISPKKKYTFAYIVEKIYDLLFDIGADKKLAALTEASKDDQNAFRQHSRIWTELLNVFETMVKTVDGETDIAGFSAVLRSGLELCSISIIPPTQDNVIIGDIDRSRLPEIKTLFMLGANDGVIPPFADDIGLLGDRERTLLNDSFFEMAADNLHKINMTDFNIFSLMLKPQKSLYISYALTDGRGKKAARSQMAAKLVKLFPDMPTETAENSGIAPAKAPAFGEMINGIRGGGLTKELYESYAYFKNSEGYKDRIAMLKAVSEDELAKRENGSYRLDELSLKKLYDGILNGSVSQLESYAECPFAYFLKYGLHIREREVYEFDALHLGNLFHSVLEDFSNGLEESKTDWRTLESGEIRERVEECVDGIIPQAFNDIIISDPHFAYTIKRVKNVMSHSINALCSHVRSGAFRPSRFEVGFGLQKALPPIVFELDGKKSIVLNGKIDRVDMLKTDEGDYVKIIDYKSGNNDLSTRELYYGLQLQLLLYMDSYIKANRAVGKNLLPGGVFYFKVSDPMVKKGRGEIDTAKLVLEEYGMNGLVLNNSTVINAIGEKEVPSDSRKKEKIETLKNVKFADEAEFAKLCEDVEKIVKVLGSDMLDGNIAVRPAKCGQKTGCDYCGYGSICRLDAREGNLFRTEKVIGEDDERKDQNDTT